MIRAMPMPITELLKGIVHQQTCDGKAHEVRNQYPHTAYGEFCFCAAASISGSYTCRKADQPRAALWGQGRRLVGPSAFGSPPPAADVPGSLRQRHAAGRIHAGALACVAPQTEQAAPPTACFRSWDNTSVSLLASIIRGRRVSSPLFSSFPRLDVRMTSSSKQITDGARM